MAKYTELFSEWLRGGGELPTLFNDLPQFNELFIGTYADREIGFETEELFKLKLENMAQIIIPPYTQRHNDLNSLTVRILNPQTNIIKSGAIERRYGERQTNNYDYPATTLPTEPDNYQPTQRNIANEYLDREEYMPLNEHHDGLNYNELAHLIDKLENNKTILLRECLKEFEPLFMQVF